MKGEPGAQGPPGPRSGGATYIRWGRTTCPNATETELVYAGRAAGTHYTQKGGTNNYLCHPDELQYLGLGFRDTLLYTVLSMKLGVASHCIV